MRMNGDIIHQEKEYRKIDMWGVCEWAEMNSVEALASLEFSQDTREEKSKRPI